MSEGEIHNYSEASRVYEVKCLDEDEQCLEEAEIKEDSNIFDVNCCVCSEGKNIMLLLHQHLESEHSGEFYYQ